MKDTELRKEISNILQDEISFYEDYNWGGPCYSLTGIPEAIDKIMKLFKDKT